VRSESSCKDEKLQNIEIELELELARGNFMRNHEE
jgi:hypothetical protein